MLVLAGCQLRDEPPKLRSDVASKAECACGDQEVVVRISTGDLPVIERRAIWRWFFENGTEFTAEQKKKN
jgi:hypothetical protein